MEQSKKEILPGTLDLMILNSLSILGLHVYGIARRIEKIIGDQLQLNQEIYPVLLHLEQMSWISSKWYLSGNNRRARYYSITSRREEAACC
jgi:PadR family transcriptional regulator, regulatory protein PadR